MSLVLFDEVSRRSVVVTKQTSIRDGRAKPGATGGDGQGHGQAGGVRLRGEPAQVGVRDFGRRLLGNVRKAIS